MLDSILGFTEEGKTQMFRLRIVVGLRSEVVAAGIIGSFLAMVLALPLLDWLHLRKQAVCPFHALTGVPCPTCGYTRAVSLLARGEMGAAFAFQPFVLILLLLTAATALMAAVSLMRKTSLVVPRIMAKGFWVVLALSWIWNLYFWI